MAPDHEMLMLEEETAYAEAVVGDVGAVKSCVVVDVVPDVPEVVVVVPDVVPDEAAVNWYCVLAVFRYPLFFDYTLK